VTEDSAALRDLLDQRMGDSQPIEAAPMPGGGSCDVFSIQRGTERWVLRRAPTFASSATAHNVLREFRILDAIKDQPVLIARPIVACDAPAVFGAPFYVMERIDGVPIRSGLPKAWAGVPEQHGSILEQLVDALVAVHAVDWNGCGLGDLAHPERYLERQIQRWRSQLDSYGGRALPVAEDVAGWLEARRPVDQPLALTHGDYKLDNVLVSLDLPPRLLAIVDWEMASIGDPLVDLAWAMIFHPGPEGTMRLGMAKEPTFAQQQLPTRQVLIERYAAGSGRDVADIGWYDVFARWKLAVVLEGSYAKFLRGESSKPVHEYFGQQVDLLLGSAADISGREGQA
jgi:aminoglycoside phosphotransferase (APT) family kinase protein